MATTPMSSNGLPAKELAVFSVDTIREVSVVRVEVKDFRERLEDVHQSKPRGKIELDVQVPFRSATGEKKKIAGSLGAARLGVASF